MNKCLVVILNWNGTKDTLACLSSLEKDSSIGYDVLVLDNASRVSEFEELINYSEEEYISYDGEYKVNLVDGIESVCIYTLSKLNKLLIARSLVNHGFAKGCNIGSYFAKHNRYEKILFLNNDTEVESGFYELLLNGLKENFAVIPQIRFFEPKNEIWNCGGTISKFGQRRYYYANQNENMLTNNDAFLVTFATGCCLLVDNNKFIDAGQFTERFFFGEEDVDLCLRLKRMKENLMCIPGSVIYHKVGGSIKGNSEILLRKSFIHYLNRFVNMKLHLKWAWWLWLPVSMLKVFKNLIYINKVSVKDAIEFLFYLIKASFEKEMVDRCVFEKILQSGFRDLSE